MKAGNITVKWHYEPINVAIKGIPPKLSQESKLETVRTLCVIEINIGEFLMGFSGSASCSKKDNFSRDKGRKVSLTRALGDAPLTKEQRKEVWEAYRTMTKFPRW